MRHSVGIRHCNVGPDVCAAAAAEVHAETAVRHDCAAVALKLRQCGRSPSEFLLLDASAAVAAGRPEQTQFLRIEKSIVVFDVAHRT